ncbi:c-type cytochrome [Rhizobium sp. BK176]|uniref:c-type cytochrome n=1 Tax=Rhizobium sp. BK176 TaxID=2587071 RepID=UPI002169C3A2|nr:c-type cytochrome [Rhizobium sp. BK176]MCS4096236.1 cytochrome c [Rhizobium sp. BK176]
METHFGSKLMPNVDVWSGQLAIAREIATAFLALFTTQASAADLERGARLFRACANCHVVDNERSTFGPSLKGVVGRKAGGLEGYNYSPAMRKVGEDGLIWTVDDLSEFLSKPTRKVPGTTMRFSGLWGFEIVDLVGYLEANR